jgi:hypothetical protein
VSGDDWKRPELWEKYAGYFSPYVQCKVEEFCASAGKDFADMKRHKI